jgi:hypothetical protein
VPDPVFAAPPFRGAGFPALAVFSAVLTLPACGPVDEGVVELAWEFVDRDGEKIYPGNLFEQTAQDACDLPARLGDQRITYDLGVQLEICDTDCDAGCGDPDCLVVPPLRFDCKTYRGSDPTIPSSDAPYRFTIRAGLELDQLGRTCLEPTPTCVGVPGPRERRVLPGLVTDLQVYQIAIDVDADVPSDRDGGSLDLEACGCA